MVIFVPERGDIVWINFDPQAGKEITKTRPAIVLSPRQYNLKSGLALFAPITSKIKGYPFEVVIKYDQIDGAVLCDQLRSLDWKARKAEKITFLDKEIINIILHKTKLLL